MVVETSDTKRKIGAFEDATSVSGRTTENCRRRNADTAPDNIHELMYNIATNHVYNSNPPGLKLLDGHLELQGYCLLSSRS